MLKELYKTYLQELVMDLGDTNTFKVGQDVPNSPPHPTQGIHLPVPAQGTSLPKLPQVSSTKSHPGLDQDSARAQRCQQHTAPRQGPPCNTLPPLHPTKTRYRWAHQPHHVQGAAHAPPWQRVRIVFSLQHPEAHVSEDPVATTVEEHSAAHPTRA